MLTSGAESNVNKQNVVLSKTLLHACTLITNHLKDRKSTDNSGLFPFSVAFKVRRVDLKWNRGTDCFLGAKFSMTKSHHIYCHVKITWKVPLNQEYQTHCTAQLNLCKHNVRVYGIHFISVFIFVIQTIKIKKYKKQTYSTVVVLAWPHQEQKCFCSFLEPVGHMFDTPVL